LVRLENHIKAFTKPL